MIPRRSICEAAVRRLPPPFMWDSPVNTPVIAGAMVSSLGADLTLALIGLSGFIPLGLGILYKRLD